MGVRLAEAADAAAIAEIYAPYVLGTVISFEEEPPSAMEMARRIANTLPTHPFLVDEDDGGVAGFAYAAAHAPRAAYRWSANASVYVRAERHRQGVGLRLYQALISILRRQRLHALFAGITLPNEKSVGLHEALGFRAVGIYREVGFKHGAWRDVGYWRLGLSQGPPASEPVPFGALHPPLGSP